MPQDDAPGPVLQYAAPRILFEGNYRFRSWRALLGIVGATSLGIPLSYIAFMQIGRSWPGLFILGPFALGFVVLAVHLIWGWVNDKVVVLQIDEDGVRYGSKVWLWDEIVQFGGKSESEGITPYVILNNRSCLWLIITPALSGPEYAALAEHVAAGLAKRFPQVHVARLGS